MCPTTEVEVVIKYSSDPTALAVAKAIGTLAAILPASTYPEAIIEECANYINVGFGFISDRAADSCHMFMLHITAGFKTGSESSKSVDEHEQQLKESDHRDLAGKEWLLSRNYHFRHLHASDNTL
ncbi:hypothetical protein AC579_10261 [Pseudocercospora musae]|uniref:Uncharacterized protein n=1 Tax=Pseudocercospora musae TaxID=113226 RepID=A0A139HZA2_9PEZI|nr:hypothetical protein AC579_10261 [Pseudocercospora musae]